MTEEGGTSSLALRPLMNEAATLFKEWSGYLKPEDLTQLESAYHFSKAAHEGQFRKSGEPYISHPLAVADILAQWHLDPPALTAALLHDVTEDTEITKTEISRNFGKPVAELVDGVSKLDKVEFDSLERAQAENFRKMLLAMARDVRVILIKLADRLHNMRTLDAVEPAKRRRIAHETLDIYAPIANRLGLNSIYQELEDLSFQHLYPDRHRVLAKAVKSARGNRREVVGKVMDAVKRKLKDSKVEAQVNGREKHLYSIYRKMREKHLTFAQVLDVFAFRIIVKDVPSCYLALGVPARSLQADTRQVQGLHRHSEGERLSVAPHDPFRSVRQPDRNPDPHAGDAQDRRSRRRVALALQDLRRLTDRASAEDPSVAPEPDRDAVRGRRLGRVPRAPQGRSVPGRGLRLHAEGPDHGVAARRDRRGFRVRRAHGHRQPLCRGEDQPGADAAAHGAEERRSRRDHHGGACEAQPALAEFRGHGEGAVSHTPLREDHALPGVGPARRAAAESGAGELQVFSRARSRTSSGTRLLKESSAKSRQHLLSDIGLGKRLSAVIARQLLSLGHLQPQEKAIPGTVGDPGIGRHGRAVREMLQADSRSIPSSG